MKEIRLFLFLVTLSFVGSVFAQRGSSATVTLNSLNHATCFGANGSLNIQLTVNHLISPYVIGGYTLVLHKNGVYYSTLSSSTVQGSPSIAIPISGLPAGNYAISGTVNIVNPTTLAFIAAPSFTSLSFFLGYQAVWTSLKEMAIQNPMSYVHQTVTTPTQTYAGARALNVESGDFWFLINPLLNSDNAATNRSVYVSLVNTANLVSFNPTTQNNYLEFRKAGDPSPNDGVYYKSALGVFKLTGVSYTDKIRVVRNGTTISFFKDQSTVALASGSTNPYTVVYSGQVNLTAFTSSIYDGLDVSTSLNCSSSEDAYATLFHELDGYYYTMKNGKLRFVFNQNYDTQNNLKFNIYDRKGLLVKTQANFPAVQATYGENYLTLDLTVPNGCIGTGIFILEVISDKKEKTFLRFYNEYNSCTPIGETPPGGSEG